MAKCRYCGATTRAGGSCSKSPHKYHEVNEGPDTCIYCGSKTRAGGSCSKSPTRTHVSGIKTKKDNQKSNNEGTGCIFVLILIGSLIWGGVNIMKNFLKNFTGNLDGYITTLVELYEYDNIEKEPLDKHIGTINVDSVLKIRKIVKKENITWVLVYKLINNTPISTYILIPDKITDIEKNTNYYTFNIKSKTWQNYYDSIDNKNNILLNNYKIQLIEQTKDLLVEKSSDNILKESIQKTHFILSGKGYLNAFIPLENEFYYIKKENKNKFLSIYRNLEKQYKKQLVTYFP